MLHCANTVLWLCCALLSCPVQQNCCPGKAFCTGAWEQPGSSCHHFSALHAILHPYHATLLLDQKMWSRNEEFPLFHDFSQVPILQLANSLAVYLHAGSSLISHFTWLILFVFSTGFLAFTAHCEVTDLPLCFQKPVSPSPCKTENESKVRKQQFVGTLTMKG